jgi:formate/nitrite transporter FocA (FNT family)
VPIAAVAAGRSTPLSVLRLWLGTAVFNLVGGWVLMGVVMAGVPKLRPTAVEVAVHYSKLGLGKEAFALAILGGTVITLMTWMQRGADSMGTQLVAAVAAAFLLVAGQLNHAIVVSLLMFAALHAGAPYGYLDWLGTVSWAALGNVIGGVGLVTMLRLVQVGQDRLADERAWAHEPGDERGGRERPTGTETR